MNTPTMLAFEAVMDGATLLHKGLRGVLDPLATMPVIRVALPDYVFRAVYEANCRALAGPGHADRFGTPPEFKLGELMFVNISGKVFP